MTGLSHGRKLHKGQLQPSSSENCEPTDPSETRVGFELDYPVLFCFFFGKGLDILAKTSGTKKKTKVNKGCGQTTTRLQSPSLVIFRNPPEL